MLLSGPRHFSRSLATQSNKPKKDLAVSPSINAFIARTGINLSTTKLLLQALTHKSYLHGTEPTNERLEFLGESVLKYHITEYLHVKYPNIPADALRDAIKLYSDESSLSSIGKSFGVNDVMRWTPAEPSKHGETKVASKVVKALIGAIFHDKGSVAAKQFIHQIVLSRSADLESLVTIEEPKKVLSALLKRKGMASPECRILKETGRQSSSPVFIVGVFSGTTKLAEGFGSSIRMAEHRAAKNALLKHYLEEIDVKAVPSDADQGTYKAPRLGDTPPVV